MEHLVGYRFHPTDEELIDYYLSSKILGNNTWLVHEAMSEVDICKFDPWDLRLQSKISSNDPVWYFFSPRDNTNPKKKLTKRTTNSGFWKATGVDRKIKRKGNPGEIGVKKTLVFYLGRVPNGVRTHWVMHEYHITFLSPEKRTYVICKLKYKGEDTEIPSGSGSEPSHSLGSNLNDVRMNTGSGFNFQVHQQVQGTPESFYGLSENDLVMPLNNPKDLSLWEAQNFDKFGGNPNMQLQTPHWTQNENECPCSLMHLNQEDWDYLLVDQGQASYRLMQENCNDYRPQKALTGVYVESCSDSDAESISAESYQETLSPVDSVGSSNGHYQTDMDAFHIGEILSLGTDYHKEVPATTESSICEKARDYRPQRKYSKGEAQGQPTRFQLSGKLQSAMPSKQEVRKVSERVRAAAPSKSEREWKMAQDTNKKISAVITEKKSWFILQDTVERSGKYPPYVHLMNMIIGFILFLALICEIVYQLAKKV